MNDIPNLTERISHMRERKVKSFLNRENILEPKKTKMLKRSPSRRFAKNYLLVFFFALFCITIVTQFLLIVWFDLPLINIF